jgi:hypothetical protein
MRLDHRVVPVLAALVTLGGCGHKHSSAPQVQAHPGTMTATVDDSAFDARDPLGRATGQAQLLMGFPGYTLAGIDEHTPAPSVLYLVVLGAPTVGHFSLQDPGDGTATLFKVHITGTDTTLTLFETDSTSTGELVVGEVDAAGMRGTFHFVGADSSRTRHTNVTLGVFDVPMAKTPPDGPAGAIAQRLARAAAALRGRVGGTRPGARVVAPGAGKRGVAPGGRL